MAISILDSTMQNCLALKKEINSKQIFLEERHQANRRILRDIKKIQDRLDWITGQLAVMKTASNEPNKTALELLTESNNYFYDVANELREIGE